MKTDKIIYTVYQLNEKRNKLGNPYIGFSKNIIKRSSAWKKELQLNYIPNLIPLYFSTEETQAFNWEQNRKVEFGWRKEQPLDDLKQRQLNGGKKSKQSGQISNLGKSGVGGRIQGRRNVESGQLESLSREIRICPYCNKTIKGPNYFKWHGENCKFK